MRLPEPKHLAVVPDVELELDDLYGLPLEEFTRTRNELAQRLAKAGQQARADEVKALAKPTVPAYAVNRLARERARDVQALLRAGDDLRKAQERGRADELRTKVQGERRAVRKLVEGARELLAAEDRPASDATLERVAKTLHAAVADDEGRRLLERGRLSTELEPSGFDALAGLTLTPSPSRRGSKTGRAGGAKRQADLKRRLRDARAEARERRNEAEAAELEAGRAAEAAREARAKADKAARAVAKAEAELEAGS